MTRWHILALLFAARTGLGLQFQTMGSVAGPVSGGFGLSNAEIGLMVGLFMAPGLFLALPAGIANRYATDRTLLAGGLALLALGGIVSALASGATGISLGRLIAGGGFLFATLYFTEAIADWFDGKEIATAMSILVMSWPFGIAMGQVLHTWLAEAGHWRLAFGLASGWCALAGLAVAALYHPPQTQTVTPGARTLRLAPVEWSLIVLAGFAWAVFNGAYVIYLSFAADVLTDRGVSALTAAAIISLGSWVMIGSGALCGQIADRFGKRDLIITVSMTAAVLALALLTRPGAATGASLLFGLVSMAPAGVIMALAGQAVAPERRAFGMGVFFTIYFAVVAASPALAGWIVDLTGRPEHALHLSAALFVSVIPAVVLFGRIKSRTPAAVQPAE